MVGYVATVRIFIPSTEENGAGSPVEAADFVLETLRNSGFKDWADKESNEGYLYPQPYEYNLETYEEEDFLEVIQKPIASLL